MAALAAGVASPAWADCLPNPPTYGGTTTCSGSTTGGITTYTGNVVVGVDATLTPGASGAAFTATSLPYADGRVSLNVAGLVDGGVKTGVQVTNGSVNTFYYLATDLDIKVVEGGKITGATAILLGIDPGSSGVARASVDNAGDIRSASGPAIVGTNRGAIVNLVNRTGGFIGGVNAVVGNLNNAGTIDGGAGSAYGFSSYALLPNTLINSGVMRSAGAMGTIDLPGAGYITITNSGQISNEGSGAAITGPLALQISNLAGGTIESAGAVAIHTDSALSLVNRGVINGSVISAAQPTYLSFVDTVGGVIRGDVLLGASNDTVVAEIDTDAWKIAGVTGRVDGGGGQNTLQFAVNRDTILDGLFAHTEMASNFQRHSLLLGQGAVATFNGDRTDQLLLGGDGGLIVNGKINTIGSAFYGPGAYDAHLNFTNTGVITATFDGDPYGKNAIELGALDSFTNAGTITAIGGNAVVAYMGSVFGASPEVRFSNTGSIIASGTALEVQYGGFDNTGLIRSTGGVGLKSSAYYGVPRTVPSTNNGVIEGFTKGVAVSSTLFVNHGTVSASDGIGVDPGAFSIIDNRAGGVINGTTASIGFEAGGGNDATIRNAGVLNGDVVLENTSGYGDYSYDVFADNGGVLNGSLRMGGADDTFIADLGRLVNGRLAGVTGTVDGGDGRDTLLLRVKADATAAVAPVAGFEILGFEVAKDARLSLTGGSPLTDLLSLSGEGLVDMNVDITGDKDLVSTYGPLSDQLQGLNTDYAPSKLTIVSRGNLTSVQTQINWATQVVAVSGDSTFENAGVVNVTGMAGAYQAPVGISGGETVTNSGAIALSYAVGGEGGAKFVNTGSIRQVAGGGPSIGLRNVSEIDNSGVIETGGTAILLNQVQSATITNSGQITSTAATAIQADFAVAMTLTNTARGEITSRGAAIRAGGGADVVRNDGVIAGIVDLSAGDDRLENYGAITGRVFLRDGNDTFVQWVGATMDGVVDGGAGLDTLTIDSTGGGGVTGGQFVNFEHFAQIGGGSLTYEGAFSSAITLDGGAAAVLANTTVSTSAFLGGTGSEHVTNAGQIQGSIALGGGGDSVDNHGFISGSVRLGDGDDVYTEGLRSGVQGVIDGGAGADTYVVELDGDRANLLARTSFERLGVVGAGKLVLALDQDWDTISLAGTGLTLQQGTFTVGGVSGGDTAETVTLARDVAKVDLVGGDDSLTLGGDAFAGAYDGGVGNDTVHFTATTPVILAGSLSGFETIALDGGEMAVTGVLGATGETTTFEGGGSQTLSILSGGVLAGTVDLGAGDDLFELAAGGQLGGVVLGGTGSDKVAIDLTSDLSLRGDQLQQFETLQVTGTGALNFTGGAAKFDHLVTDSKDLTLAAGSSLNAGDLSLSGDANTMTVAGAFTGVVDLGGGNDTLRLTTGGTFTGSAQGGAGSDRLELALGGTDAAPTALGATPFTSFETLSLQSGVVSVSGDYGFDTIEVRNGRLIGLAGSHLAASNITVAQGATFGSAGAVTGDITVAGTLSPGASPGTMTVTGDLALVSGSTALFEFTPTVSDQLVVSGTVTIAQGSTLKLVGAAALTPGRRVDLITAGGGIVGSFSTIDGAQGLNLHIAQSATHLQALGLFTTDTTFSSQVSNLIGTLNTALIEDKVSAALVAALPALVDPTTSKSDPRALARLTPQAYASAAQLALEDGLSIVDASRAQARFAPQTPGLFGFGQAIASRRTLGGDAAAGVAKGKIDSTGGLAGVGYGVESAWAGVFVGYLNGRQRISDLDIRTGTGSFAIGAQGQVRVGGFQLGAMAAHEGADVDTRRSAPGGTTATGDYKLKSWIADVNLAYQAKLNADWAVRPRLGASYVHAKRDGFVERGGGAFALTVEGNKSTVWFVDGQVELLGGQAAGARLHPFASIGFRSTADGGDTTASATLTGLSTPITVAGLDRSGTLATAGAGVAYDLAHGLTVSAAYSSEFGDGGHQAALVGLNWKF